MNRHQRLRLILTAHFIIAGCATLGSAAAQGLTPHLNGPTADMAGPHIESAWVFGAYYSLCSTASVTCQKSALPVYSTGAGLALGWITRTERTVSALNYSGEFAGSPTASSLSAFGQSARFDLSRKLKPRWRFDLHIDANASSLQARLFAPSQSLVMVETADTTDSLAHMLLSGVTGSSTAALGDTIRSSSGADQLILVGGDERRSLNAVTRVHFSQTERLEWNFSALGSYVEYPKFEIQPGSAARSDKVRDGAAAIEAVYALSPRSQVSVEGFSGITGSIFQNYLVQRGEAGYSRMLTNKWFTHLHGGMGAIRPLNNFGGNRYWHPDYVGGGSWGFKGRDHSAVLSVSRSIADSYGFGFATELTTIVTWSYGKPNSLWGFGLMGGHQHLTAPGQRSLEAWVGQAGVSRKMGRNLVCDIEGVYASNVALNPGSANAGTVSRQFDTAARAGFRVSARWVPEPKSAGPGADLQKRRSTREQSGAR